MATCPSCHSRYDDGSATCARDGVELLPDEAFAAVDAELPAGRVVGEYCVRGRIGAGSFGVVYSAVHPIIGKRAAIKVLSRVHASNPRTAARFINEARAVNQVRHKNIVDVFSFGMLEDGRHYFVMELLDGRSLLAVLRAKGRLVPGIAVALLRDIARALDAAHAAGVVHRDLKPENVHLTRDEGAVVPKLLDFGIAKLISAEAPHSTTQTGSQMGTPAYMSPEQCRGREVDRTADVYALGVMAFELLTGRLPFDGAPMDVMLCHMGQPPPRPSEIEPELPAALDAPVLAMLAKEPRDRPASASAAIERLERATRDAGCALDPPTANALLGPPGIEDPRARAIAEAATLAPLDVSAEGAPRATRQTNDSAPLPASSRASGSSATSALAERPARSRAAIAGALVIGLAGGAAFWLLGRSPSPNLQAPAAPTGTSGSAPSSAMEATPTPSAEPAPAAGTAGTAQEVPVLVRSTPDRAELLLDGRKIGEAGTAVRLPYGQAPVQLVVRAPGHQPKTITVVPTASAVVAVELPKASGPAVPKELEY